MIEVKRGGGQVSRAWYMSGEGGEGRNERE